jgi:TetR/AcrR family transcriptional regulator
MSDMSDPEAGAVAAAPDAAAPARKRPKPGERRIQILQTLAGMLEQPGAERITTAALAARLQVSEAALYRHFASKAQMFEGLIEFIETTVISLINEIESREESGQAQAARIVRMLLDFAATNRGMTRVLIGDALVSEHERLQERINQLHERIESSLRQSFRVAALEHDAAEAGGDAGARAALAMAYVVGRWHRFAKSGFRKAPAEGIDAQLPLLLA